MIYNSDKWLKPFKKEIDSRYQRLIIKRDEIAGCGKRLADAINNHLYYGVHRVGENWMFREWAPNAVAVYLVGEWSEWKPLNEYKLKNIGGGNWEMEISGEIVKHGDLFKWYIEWQGESGLTGEERIPAYATRCVQDKVTHLFAAQVWEPENRYVWRNNFSIQKEAPLIYETHIGMSGEERGISTFKEFRERVLPRIARLGYNTIQIMALQEHPYYGSFGYQVSSFFAISSKFGTPEEFKELVDEAHKLGIAVVMDIVHSHAVKNELEGLSKFDGTYDLYFHKGDRGDHPSWGTRCFNYGKDEVISFLLSNCKFWLEEYNLDGFRFDGITSMLYYHHGLERCFTGYEDYFNGEQDVDALVYLGLANILIKELKPHAITIAEDMSGMPGLSAPIAKGGFGFDYRMSMGVADYWIKVIKELPDENWNVCDMWWQLTNKRADEKTISYAECHDQAMVGDKTIIFRLLDSLMYTSMNLESKDIMVDRGIALVKMIKLLTIATAGDGYLNFMGNEFGHPEWIDFPREGNNWSYKHARRLWSLADSPFLRYGKLEAFDGAMVKMFAKGNLLKKSPISLYNDEPSQVLVMERGGYIFVFNFSPTESYTDYSVKINKPGEYKVVLDTDWKEFNGFERNSKQIVHYSLKDGKDEVLKLYLPARSSFVLKKKIIRKKG